MNDTTNYFLQSLPATPNAQFVLTLVGALGAGAFFLWKIFTGWLIINLQVSLDLERQSSDDGDDFLAIQLNLTKGPTDTLWIKDVSLRVSVDAAGGKTTIVRFPEITLLAQENGKLNWGILSPGEKKLTLSPGEVTQFGRTVRVAPKTSVLVEAAVFGNRTFWSTGFQWRASAVSLPAQIEKPASRPVVSLVGSERPDVIVPASSVISVACRRCRARRRA